MTFPEVIICAADEVDNFAQSSITHLISIRNPSSPSRRPSWFKGSFLELFFGDVVSIEDARACRTSPPTSEHIKDAIGFTDIAFERTTSKTLIFCDYGASRSPALAYVVLAAHFETGREQECLQRIIDIRPDAVPNLYVV